MTASLSILQHTGESWQFNKNFAITARPPVAFIDPPTPRKSIPITMECCRPAERKLIFGFLMREAAAGCCCEDILSKAPTAGNAELKISIYS